MQRLMTMVVLVVAVGSLVGCGGSSRTVYTSSPATNIVPYVYYDNAKNHIGLAGVQGSNGQVQWHGNFGRINWQPLLVGGTIYLSSLSQDTAIWTLWAIRRSDGGVMWSTPISDTTGFNPLLDADATTVLVNTGTALQDLDATTGQLRWQHPAAIGEVRSTSTPHIVLYEEEGNNMATKIVALHADTGTLAWEAPSSNKNGLANTSDRAIFASAEAVYLADVDQTIMALRLVDGHVLWHSQQHATVIGLTAQTVITRQGFQPMTLAGLDSTNGAGLWSDQVANSLGQTIIAGTTLINTAYQDITAIDTRTGEQLWQKTLDPIYSTNDPLISDGVLFVLSQNSRAHGSPGCFSWQNCADYLYAMHLDSGQIYWTDTLTDANGFVRQDGV